MKKASRFAALLAAVMLFGSVAAMPALAEDVTSTPVPTATAEPTVTPAPTDNGQSAPNNSGSAYIIAQTVTDAAGGELVNFDLDLVGLKQYVKVKVEITCSGGSSPECEATAALALGDASDVPV